MNTLNALNELYSRSLPWRGATTPPSVPIVIAPPVPAAARRTRRKARGDWYALGVVLLMISSTVAAVISLLGTR